MAPQNVLFEMRNFKIRGSHRIWRRDASVRKMQEYYDRHGSLHEVSEAVAKKALDRLQRRKRGTGRKNKVLYLELLRRLGM